MTRSDDSTKPRDVREPLRWPSARFAMSPERWAAWLGVQMVPSPSLCAWSRAVDAFLATLPPSGCSLGDAA